jgi:predicted transcriptional regulator
MSQSLIELATELTFALIQTGSLLPKDVQETLQKTHTILTALKALEESGSPALGQSPPGDWRKSITKYLITCLECGHAFKQLSIRHLRTHGLDARSYRTKYGIPQSQPLAAWETSARRRQVVRETRPWEKAPTYRKRHAGEHPQSTAPEAEAGQDETEAASAAAPTQPKRQRKTTLQKKAPRTSRPRG